MNDMAVAGKVARARRSNAAARTGPVDYRSPPAALGRKAYFVASTLYIVGGLYGNLAALDALEHLAASEPAPTAMVFNGDYHWFDAEPDWFAEVERRVAD